ncbi:MAG: DEAD/DEAH box helicase family protein [Dehalococcoidales bacterium]|nr:DEAD/DEAH box helicase family protein [Dehalococcoidales bacterium]
MSYSEFIERKKIITQSYGFAASRINTLLFPFQRDIVKWALMKGRAALFTMTGTGKTMMQCEWAHQVHRHTGGKVLILAPLAVSSQTVQEAQKIGIKVNICASQGDVKDGINITNYEKLQKFDPGAFVGIVLDESSILKTYDGKTRTEIIESFKSTPYRLACTATPAPNDFMELGNHAEFLGVMSRAEMLSMFFVHDGSDTSKWRLKGHAEMKFWEWVSGWAVVLNGPSDLGYEDSDFILPPLNIHEIKTYSDSPTEGHLFAIEAKTLQERQQARRETVRDRVEMCADIVNGTNEPFLVWCDLNIESNLLKKAIDGAVEVKGSDSNEHKEQSMKGFSDGDIRVLVTKPSIAGFGMNWQHCSKMAFVGLSDSFEQYFQAVRRCWRFGQTKPVDVFIITSDLEGAVVENIKRKERDAERLQEEMVKFTRDIMRKNIHQTKREVDEYKPDKKMIIPEWLRGENVA